MAWHGYIRGKFYRINQSKKTRFILNYRLMISSDEYIKIVLEYADFYTKILLILDTASRNSVGILQGSQIVTSIWQAILFA